MNTNEKSLNINDIRRICFHDSLPAGIWDELDSQNDENINGKSLKHNDTILKLLETSLKLKSTFVQGHFPGRNWIILWMKMNEKSLKNSGKTYNKKTHLISGIFDTSLIIHPVESINSSL